MNLTKPLILASGSPRRQRLLHMAGYQFSVEKADTDENYPATLEPSLVAEYLAVKKAEAFRDKHNGAIVLTADTIVVCDRQVLGKPGDTQHATEMLRLLSANRHEVITGVAFLNGGHIESFSDSASVCFKKLEDWEIDYYVSHYQPFDKAGGYGIQEWIGLIGIEKIEGSYFNVMGLPVHKIHEYLKKFRA